MPALRTVATAHRASYADPVAVRAGEALRLTGRAESWDGHRWLWAAGPDGREGWVPDDLVTTDSGEALAVRDYSAVELGCAIGDRVDVLDERHGWALCRDAAGREGWVPVRNLTPG